MDTEKIIANLKQQISNAYPITIALHENPEEIQKLTWLRIESLYQNLPYKYGDTVLLKSTKKPIDLTQIQIYSKYIKRDHIIEDGLYINSDLGFKIADTIRDYLSDREFKEIDFNKLTINETNEIFDSLCFVFGRNFYSKYLYSDIERIANESERTRYKKFQKDREMNSYNNTRITLRDAFGDDDLWNLMDC